MKLTTEKENTIDPQMEYSIFMIEKFRLMGKDKNSRYKIEKALLTDSLTNRILKVSTRKVGERIDTYVLGKSIIKYLAQRDDQRN